MLASVRQVGREQFERAKTAADKNRSLQHSFCVTIMTVFPLIAMPCMPGCRATVCCSPLGSRALRK